ncbi:MAG: hypothetical protein IJ449_01990 [Clostridia bacterium]|nr:hypothetical protein [Clostridia bacterium]
MKLNFAKGAWQTGNAVYAYSYRFDGTPEFIQNDDCVENRENSAAMYDWDNVSLLSRAPYTAGAKITAECAFSGAAAPLIVIADKLYEENGALKYGDYIEVVLWKNGVNVWRMKMDEEKTVTWKKLLGITLPYAEDVRHTLSVSVNKEHLEIEADALSVTLDVQDLYETFHLGIDACEGLCRFYSMEII